MSPKESPLGRRGEDAAAAYLKKKGYAVVERNLRIAGVEIDIVTTRGNRLCLVEVKARRSRAFGDPFEFVDFRKQQRLIRGARALLARKKYAGFQVRFDVVSVVVTDAGIEIDFLEDAFEASF